MQRKAFELQGGKTRRGRPPIGGSVAVHLRFSEEIAFAIDTYREQCLPGANRQEAVRDLIRLQLASQGMLEAQDD